MLNGDIRDLYHGFMLLGAHPSTAQRAKGALGDGGRDIASEVPWLGMEVAIDRPVTYSIAIENDHL